MMENILNKSVEFLKGVGPRVQQTFNKEFNIFTYNDLINYYPFKYVDKSQYYRCKDVDGHINTYIQIKGKIIGKNTFGEGRKKRLVAQFADQTGIIELVWFNNIKYWSEKLSINTNYIIFGKPTQFNKTINITHPEIKLQSEEESADLIPFQPFYNTSERAKKGGLGSLQLSKLIYKALLETKNQIQETLPDYIRDKLKLIDLKTALINIHFPKNSQYLDAATKRLKFEEIFFMQLCMLSIKEINKVKQNGYYMPKVGENFNNFYKNHLPFPLTNAQKRVIKEIREDFLSQKQMNRLLQGDVGSGKTITAVLLMLIAIDNGFQTCLMAPTEILATQHYNNVKNLLKDLDINIRLLTGSTKAKERKEILPKVENNEIQILIGTHALIQDKVIFDKLGLVVIDEQHRFGVEQRAKLWKKNLIPPHVLVMTATPIPRTLAMTLYGDLSLSVIDELPAGRKPIITKHFYQNRRSELNHFLKEEIHEGRQIYVVYPLIKESETLDYKNLMEGYEQFQRDFPEPEYKICCVHGQLPADQKEQQMQAFIQKEAQIMLATTVIEVGVDIPNASVMLIENAERFGLSQLHQLRGRVGRGAEQSYCLLLSGNKLTSESKQRIQAMISTNDGFKIADIDLKLRGPGDIAGTQQSGLLNFKLLNLASDEKIISTSRNLALSILEKDPKLSNPENQSLNKKVNAMISNDKMYFKIG